MVFAGLALVLASIGIYGVMSYSVTQRTHDRHSPGYRRADTRHLQTSNRAALRLASDVGVGLAGAFALTRLMATLLYGVSTTDPLTFALIAILLAGVSLLASYIPARRATRVDPMIALRYE